MGRIRLTFRFIKHSSILIIIVIIMTACGGTRSIEWLVFLSLIHHYKENNIWKSPNITFVKFNNDCQHNLWHIESKKSRQSRCSRVGDDKSNEMLVHMFVFISYWSENRFSWNYSTGQLDNANCILCTSQWFSERLLREESKKVSALLIVQTKRFFFTEDFF